MKCGYFSIKKIKAPIGDENPPVGRAIYFVWRIKKIKAPIGDENCFSIIVIAYNPYALRK